MVDPVAAPAGDDVVRAELVKLDSLLAALEQLPESSRDPALDAVASLSYIYGQALARIVAMAALGQASLERLRGDELIGHLMELHDLLPDPAPAGEVFIPVGSIRRR